MKIIQALLITSLLAFGGVLHASDFSDIGPESLFYDMDYDNEYTGPTIKQEPVDTDAADDIYMHTDVIPAAMLEPF